MGGHMAQTVRYRYSLGLHLALCHGPIDAIREILVDRRTAWSVLTGSGTSGGGAAVETRIGSVAGLSATPALAGDLGQLCGSELVGHGARILSNGLSVPRPPRLTTWV